MRLPRLNWLPRNRTRLHLRIVGASGTAVVPDAAARRPGVSRNRRSQHRHWLLIKHACRTRSGPQQSRTEHQPGAPAQPRPVAVSMRRGVIAITRTAKTAVRPSGRPSNRACSKYGCHQNGASLSHFSLLTEPGNAAHAPSNAPPYGGTTSSCKGLLPVDTTRLECADEHEPHWQI